MSDRTHSLDLSQYLDPTSWQIVCDAAAIARSRGWRLFAVGGLVRDCLLRGVTSLPAGALFPSLDLDLVVEGEAGAGVAVARELHARYGEARLQTYDKFQTAELFWPEFMLDVATAREEVYAYPGANPDVRATTLERDLYRRDFTINAMAVELDPPYRVIDPFGGWEDLLGGVLRALRSGSFAEDPRRIFRAARFATRFGFALAPETEAELRAVTQSGLHDGIGGARLRFELTYTFATPHAVEVLRCLEDWGALRCLHPDLHLAPEFARRWRQWRRWARCFAPEEPRDRGGILLLCSDLPPERLPDVDLGWGGHWRETLQRLHALEAALAGVDVAALRPSAIAARMRHQPLSVLLLAAARGDRALRRVLWCYLTRWQQVKPAVSGDELLAMGCPRGKAIGRILDTLRAATLDGDLAGREATLSAARAAIAAEQIAAESHAQTSGVSYHGTSGT